MLKIAGGGGAVDIIYLIPSSEPSKNIPPQPKGLCQKKKKNNNNEERAESQLITNSNLNGDEGPPFTLHTVEVKEG